MNFGFRGASPEGLRLKQLLITKSNTSICPYLWRLHIKLKPLYITHFSVEFRIAQSIERPRNVKSNWENVWFPAGARDLSLPRSAQTGSGDHTAFCSWVPRSWIFTPSGAESRNEWSYATAPHMPSNACREQFHNLVCSYSVSDRNAFISFTAEIKKPR